MLKFILNPYELMMRLAKKRYPKIKAQVIFTNDLPKYNKKKVKGYTLFRPKEIPLIGINVSCSVERSLEVLAHELAHVVVGYSNKHNAKWNKVFNQIHEDWCLEMEKRYKAWNKKMLLKEKKSL